MGTDGKLLMTDAQKKLVQDMNGYITPALPLDSDKETANRWISKNINRFKFLKWQENKNGR